MKSQVKKIKLLILGESSVGKTALLNRFSLNTFTSTCSTSGMDFTIKEIEIDTKKVQLQVWDTAGQEKYRSITFNLYKETQGILLVFDLTNAKTFQTLENWMRLIKENINEGFQIALLGTKCDLKDQIEVTQEMITEFLDQNNFRFEYYETSSLENINVQESFIDLAKKIFRTNKQKYQSLIVQGIVANDNNHSILRNVDNEEQKKDKCCN